VTQQLERLQFNTAISSLMELSNAAIDWAGDPGSLREALEILVQLLSPFAPHIAEELWRELGHTEELTLLHWPDAESRAGRRRGVPDRGPGEREAAG